MSQGKEYEPNDKDRERVNLLAGVAGTPQEIIARVLGISDKTLRKYYAEELAISTAVTVANVAKTLYTKAMGNGPQSVAAAIFYLKCRGRWKEQPIEVAHTGAVAVAAVDAVHMGTLSDDELRVLAAAGARLAVTAAPLPRPEVTEASAN